LATVVLARRYSRISGAMSEESEIDRFWKRSATAAPIARSCMGLA
jgi:hypothetical protein